MSLNSNIGGPRSDPPITLDAAHVERLQTMAMAIMKTAPDIADRLLAEIERSQVVDSDALPATVVTIGSKVTFTDDSNGREQTVTVVFPPDADIAERRVSVLTPIGAALIGLERGASISWETRDGHTRELTVVDVTQPDADGGAKADTAAGTGQDPSLS